MDAAFPPRGRPLVFCLVLAGVTLAVYGSSLRGGFVWDDVPIVVEGTLARGGAGLGQALLAPDVVKPYYRPITRASFFLDAAVWGNNSAGFHATNVALQLANVVALFLLVGKLFGRTWLAFGTAVLLAVHPINAETVNFISARNNLLALLFLQGALFWLLAAVRSGRASTAWASGACWFLALGSKESAAAGILVLGAVVLWPVRGVGERPARRLRLLLPHVAFLCGYLVLRHLALGGATAGLGIHSPFEVARINFHVVPEYLGLVLRPAALNVFHGVPTGWAAGIPGRLLAWLAIVAATGALVVQRSPPSLLGLTWAVVNFLPVANLVPIPSAAMAERFVYLPAVGLWMIASDQALRLVDRVPWKRAAIGLQAAIVVALGATTVRRNADWRDDLTLFQASVDADPRSVPGLFNLGTTLRDGGDLAGARRAWERALEVDPRDAGTLVQLGTLSAVQGDLVSAERLYRRALDADPAHAMANLNLAKVCERTGRVADAARFYGRFLDLATSVEAEHVPAARASRDRILRSLGGPR